MIRVIRYFLFLLMTGLCACRPHSEAELWIWVPGGGAQELRIRALVSELGLKARFIDARNLLATSPHRLRAVKALVVFEGSGPEMLGATGVREILRAGGTVALAGDSASFLESSLGFRVKAMPLTPLRWTRLAQTHLAPGTFDPSDGTALVYGYGTQITGGWEFQGFSGEVWGVGPSGECRWAERAWEGGRLIVAGLPLAAYAIESNSQGARVLLEHVADLTAQPRLWPTPEGLGGLAINVHIDGAPHLRYLPALTAAWPREVRGSWHLTAGPDLEHLGDGQGLDVNETLKGKPWVAKLLTLGEVGSHGGWAHNVWAREAEHWPLEQTLHFIKLNMDALLTLGGTQTSFSTPVGLHPPAINPWLESQGVRASYFAGEAGSPPTRPWTGGKPWSPTLWAFPLATRGKQASAYEFKASGITDKVAAGWSIQLLAFCRDTHSLRLVYLHPTDWADYPGTYGGLVRSLAGAVRDQTMTANTMTSYASFLDRHQAVSWTFQARGSESELRADGPNLESMTFRLPGRWSMPETPGVIIRIENDWTWVVIQDQRTHFKGRLLR